ncbi:MAG: hypothetical protein R3A51_08155 [Nannocystaceae bacterium]|nr:hypothetical protein [Myxococcales bacterium]
MARVLGPALSVALAASPCVAAAAPSASKKPPPRALELHKGGIAMMEQGRYDAAAQAFRKALAELDDPREYLYGRAAVISELKNAQLAAYNVDHDPIHLCEFKDTLGHYTRQLVDAFRDEGESLPELQLARENLTELQAMIHAHANRMEIDVDDVCPGEDPIAAAPPVIKPKPEPEPEPAAVTDTPPPAQADKDPRPLLVSGGVLTGISLALLGTASYFFVRANNSARRAEALWDARDPELGQWETKTERDLWNESREDYQLSSPVAIVTVVTGGIALAGGITLLVLGAKQRNRQQRASLSPYGGPRSAGLVFNLRF